MDGKIKDVISQTAKELGITEFKTTKVVENIFGFLRNSMTKIEFLEYYVPKFGTFAVIEKRYETYKEKRKLKRKENSQNENISTNLNNISDKTN